MNSNEVIHMLAASVSTPASYIMSRKFGTTLKAMQSKQDIDVYSAFFRVAPPDHPAMQYVPREACYLIATMFYKYRNRHNVDITMRFEDALHIGYTTCGSESGRKIYERLLSQIPGTISFNKAFAEICRRLTKNVDLTRIDYAKLLEDICAWNKNRNVIIRWSRVMHKYTSNTITIGGEL